MRKTSSCLLTIAREDTHSTAFGRSRPYSLSSSPPSPPRGATEDSAQCRLPVPMVYESFEVLRPYAGLFTPRRLDGAAAARVLVGGAEGPRGGNTHSCVPASAREAAG